MATPYIKNDGVNYKIQAGLPSAGVAALQFTDSASSTVVTVPSLTGTMALTTIGIGTNTLVTTDMATAFRALDGLVMPNVLGYLTNTPPASPTNGDCYIIGTAPTGAWSGQGSKVARYSTIAAAWEFYTPKNGWTLEANGARESYRYTGGAWEIFYQEGTWTPALFGSSVAGANSYTVQTGTYKKIGALVFTLGRVTLSAKDAAMAGSIFVGGLPFTSASGLYSAAVINASNFNALTTPITASADPAQTRVGLYKNAPNAVFTAVVAADITATTDIVLSSAYTV